MRQLRPLVAALRSPRVEALHLPIVSASASGESDESRAGQDAVGIVRQFEVQFTVAVQRNDLRQALQLKRKYEELRPKSRTFLYNQLLKLYAHKRRPDEAYRLFEELRERDLRPTSLTFACLLNACAKAGDRECSTKLARRAAETFEQIASYGLQPSAVHYHSLMDAQGRAGLLDEVFETVERMRAASIEPSALSYNIVLAACSRAGCPHRAVSAFRSMQAQGLATDASSWTTVLGAFAAAKDVDGAYAWWLDMQSHSIAPDDVTLKVLAQAFGGNVTLANEILEEALVVGRSASRGSHRKLSKRDRLQHMLRATSPSLLDVRSLSIAAALIVLVKKLDSLITRDSGASDSEQSMKDGSAADRPVTAPEDGQGPTDGRAQPSERGQGGLLVICGAGSAVSGKRSMITVVLSLLQSLGLNPRLVRLPESAVDQPNSAPIGEHAKPLGSASSGVVVVEAADLQRHIKHERQARETSQLFHFVGARALAVGATVCGLTAAAYLIPSLSSV